MEYKLAIIDDNSDDIYAVKRMLSKSLADFQIVGFTDPLDALAELSKNSVDCIILDFNFPEMNGLEFIKAFEKTIVDTPIIITTGQGNEKIAVEALKNGAFDYIMKNELSESLLSKAIIKAIEKRDHERIKKANHEFIEKLVDITPVPLFYKDRNGIYLGCNQAFEAFAGKNKAEIIGKTAIEITNKKNAEKYAEMDAALLAHPGKQSYEFEYERGDHEIRYVVFQKVTYNNAKDEVEGIIGTITDITESKLREAELAEKTFTDSLTGIANRRYFDENIEKIWHHCFQEQEPLALIMIDIDLFKNYNDYYGHQAGDECLKKIARGIKTALLRQEDIAVRYGGEEFLVILPRTEAKGAVEVAERIKQTILALRIKHEDSNVEKVVTVSQGIVVMNHEHGSIYEGLVQADHLLYRAKKNGRNRIEI